MATLEDLREATADDPAFMSASDLAREIGSGRLTAEAAVSACLARIAEREPERHAFAWINPDQALAEARERDRAEIRGAIHGVPVGIKDIIDTHDMPTAMGSPIYADNRPSSDAACVAILRSAGAVMIGKTVTAEFAGSFPGPTTNPHDPAHTPGGSSSGSAAGVADFMMPLAIGTQTGGSVLRPSSYCGVIGFKPTFGTFNLGGVKPAAQSLDTLGLHARTVEDIELASAVLVNRPLRILDAPSSPLRVALCRTGLWDEASPESRRAVEDAAARLAAAGAEVGETTLPAHFDSLIAARDRINDYERARLMAFEWTHHRDRLSDKLAKIIGDGAAMSYETYVEAIAAGERGRAEAGGLFADADILLTLAVDGPAPAGLGHAGDPRFQGLWTFLHLPAITLPTHVASSGLPVGIQLVGGHRRDGELLAAANWVCAALGTGAPC